jgi:TPR repeat protein
MTGRGIRVLVAILALAVFPGVLVAGRAQPEESRAVTQQKAEAGDAAAQCRLGVMLFEGKQGPKDAAEAARWFRKAADQGHNEAQVYLAVLYLSGEGLPQDLQQALYWFRRAANAGNADAQKALGVAYGQGSGVPKDEAEAARWYRLAAEQGRADAQLELGDLYSTGSGVPKDPVEAVRWYRRAADQGYARAEYRLAEAYSRGKGVPKSAALAAQWYRRAAEHGDADGQYQIGLAYDRGDGVPKSVAEAVKWYRRAAEQGNEEAQFALGACYGAGSGVPKDDAEAQRWYRKAAQQGHAGAQYNVGVFYESAGDPEEAFLWYTQAASWLSLAQSALGRLYFSGKGVSQNYEEGVRWFRKAAAQGSADAQANLAAAYAAGRGVAPSGATAADWYYRAGLAYLKAGRREGALACAEGIRNLIDARRLTVPNAFLADELMKAIYSQPNDPEEERAADEQGVSMGTCWVVASGHVITNFHVIEGRTKFTLLFPDGTKVDAEIAGVDQANDLALLRAQALPQSLPALPVAVADPSAGTRVFAVGYPHPDIMGIEPKVTDGIISAAAGLGDDVRHFQMSVPVQSGNSGGPLLNMKGEVVGVVVAKLDAARVLERTGDLPENVNYAIKGSYLRALLATQNVRLQTAGLARASELALLASRVSRSVAVVIAE